MGKLSILMPYRPDNGPRDQAFSWVKAFYKKMLPEPEICISDCTTPLFSRAQAVNNAAKQATGDIFIIADADIILNPDIINKSVQLLNEHAWIIPYSRVKHISKKSTNELLNTGPSWPPRIDFEVSKTADAGARNFVGGLNIIPRKNFEAVGGFDERFLGYGAEDDAFGHSVNTLCGPYLRLDTDIFHLWHPRVRTKSNPHYQANCALLKRYVDAGKSKKRMLSIVNERVKD
ncbi:putative glycosyltransferase involved in capsule biosynthesis [Neobacillus niacini]|uniref:galactosyltransferase-related protein n=1 Tax=Neobacillus niacini TaxID=86668 RepID=UPI0027809F6D|nr:galactosyltransferase-related protein [Neobacillus niacini]MDQ1002253.1 putative glycosyltransferase involved in capsule biosynthesis [Neobacillus niacini]